MVSDRKPFEQIHHYKKWNARKKAEETVGTAEFIRYKIKVLKIKTEQSKIFDLIYGLARIH